MCFLFEATLRALDTAVNTLLNFYQSAYQALYLYLADLLTVLSRNKPVEFAPANEMELVSLTHFV